MRRYIAGIAALILVALGPAAAPAAQAAGPVIVSGRLGERAIPTGAGTPSRLDTTVRTPLELTVVNNGDQALDVGTVVLRGRVLGITFFNYETSVSIAVPPRSTATRLFSLDLSGLKSQAVGLFNTEVRILDQRRDTIASRRTAVDVRGWWRSVYSLFGIGLAMATVATFARACLDLARHRLSPNRWRRAVRFFVPGLGLGMTVVFTLSALRVFLPSPFVAMLIVLIAAASGFALGYFTPTPDPPDVLVGARVRGAEYGDPLP
jgi:hypothetical protein